MQRKVLATNRVFAKRYNNYFIFYYLSPDDPDRVPDHLRNRLIIKHLEVANVYKYIFAPHFGRIAVHSRLRILNYFTRCHVILPPVPGAGDHFPIQRTLTERSASVQTSIIDRVNLPADIRKRYRLAFNLKLSHRPRG